MRQHFLLEILNQIWITDHLLNNSKDLGPCTQRDETSYHFEWIQGQNQTLGVRKLSLLTMPNLPSTDRVDYKIPINMIESEG